MDANISRANPLSLNLYLLNFKCCTLCLGCVVDDNETGAHLELSSKLFIMNLAIATTRKQPICLVKQRYSKITTYVLVGVGTTTRMCKTYQIMAKKVRLDLRFKEFYHELHNTNMVFYF